VADIFNEEGETKPEQTNDAANTSQADLFVAKLLEIKRDDGTPKYESIEAALDALKASQDHIRNLENENGTLKTKAQERDQLQETLERIQREKTMNEENKSGTTTTNSGLSEEAAGQLIERKLQEKALEAAQIGNVQKVHNTLVNKYGSEEEAKKQLAAKAAEIGLTPKALGELAKNAPNAVLAYFNEAGKPSTTPNISSTRLPNGAPIEPIKAPEKSILAGPGATARNQAEFIRRIKENVYRENGIT
jgi:hypothetical protein